jgi:hypothetical protein
MEEDRKTGNNVMALSGDFGFGSITSTGPQIRYNVTGTFDNATKVLTFKEAHPNVSSSSNQICYYCECKGAA